MLMVRVAIDNSPLKSGHKVRGIGVNTRELITNLQKVSDDIQIQAVDISKNNLSKFDLVHITHFNPYFLSIPLIKPKTKVLITIHDLIQLKYPKHYPPGIKGSIKLWIQKLLLKSYDGVLTISEVSKKDIINRLGLDPKKVFVVLLSAKSVFRTIADKSIVESTRLKFRLPRRFVLYVGDVNYNKNIFTLIKACGAIKVPLVLVGQKAAIEGMGMELMDIKGPRDWIRFLLGKPHPETAHYKEMADEFIKNKNVIRTGYIPDYDLVAIYNLATVYVQPSFSEGFGLSVLEAQACGTPVIASNIGAHREIADDSVLFFDPHDTKDLIIKIEKVFQDSKIKGILIDKGIANSRKYNWDKTARGVIDVYKSIIG